MARAQRDADTGGMQTTYAPLTDYLAAQSPETKMVTLSLPAIEAILGAPLPRSAATRSWWLSPTMRRRTPWVAAGWKVRQVGMRTMPSTVTFARSHEDGPL